MTDGHRLPESIELVANEARTVHLAVVAAIDELPPGDALDLCAAAQRILVVEYLPDLPELGEE